MTTLDYSRPSSKVHPSLEWDNVLGSADGLFRGTVESLHQALYLYRPIWSDGRIVDLEIVYCNAAASALPFTARIVPGALASDVFNDPELAMREAGTTWEFGETEPYSVLRHGLIDGIESSIRYEIHTRRIANFILQTSTDHTIADELQRTEARQRMVLDSLNEGVTLLSPVFDDDQRMIGTRALYSNKTAQRLRSADIGIFEGSGPDDAECESARWLWESTEPDIRVIAGFSPTAPELGDLYVEVEAVRVGDTIVQVARDRTDEMQSTRARVAAETRFSSTIEALSEGCGIWDAVVDAAGTIIDFVLSYANPSFGGQQSIGALASEADADADLVTLAREAWDLRGTSTSSIITVTRFGRVITWRTSLVRVGDQVVSLSTDITEICRHAAQLEWVATHMRLTGLLNFDGFLAAVEARTSEAVGSYAVIWVNLNELDTIRPTFGFAAGDAALLTATERLQQIADRHGAIAAQPKETSLALLLPSVVSGSAVLRIATDIAHELSVPFEAESIELLLAPSVGCAIGPLHGSDGESLLRRAKTAAWHAHHTGAVVLRWRADLGAQQIERVSLLGGFGRAMTNGELFLEFQPKIDVRTRKLVGAEALVRWMHPIKGRIAPNSFIEGVEASALCRPFTLWVIREALTKWAPVVEQRPGIKVAVNVPVPLIIDLEFMEQLADELVSIGADPSWLQVELTERGLVGSISELQAGIEQLSMLGISVALDDFGTGQSSLAYLRKLNLDEVKIDRAFIANLQVDLVNQAIVGAVVAIADLTGMKVCAEGVETEEEMDAIAALGCDSVQGFLLGRPMSVPALLSTLR